jgi:hypothetical protein
MANYLNLAGNSEGPVGGGLDAVITQNGKVVAYASSLNFDEDFELEGIRTIGYYGDRFFKSLGYTANCSIETFVLRAAALSGAFKTTGWQPDGTYNLNTAGSSDIVIADLNSLEVLFTLMACKNNTVNTQFPARGLNTRAVQLKVSRIIPGLNVS